MAYGQIEMGSKIAMLMMEGVNLTEIYCKHFCKHHNVPSVHQ
jgi:hypothetical protein